MVNSQMNAYKNQCKVVEEKTAQALWQDYRFLTKEMVKFLTKKDMDLFYSLMEQRGRLQSIIEQTADNGFKESSIGRSLLVEIIQENRHILDHLQMRRNQIKKHHHAMEAYNGPSPASIVRRDWKR